MEEKNWQHRLEALSREGQELVQDLMAWMELKLTYTRLELEHTLNQRINELLAMALAGVVALMAVFFLSLALAFALGSWLGHPGWGLLVVALGYALLALYFRLAGVQWVRITLSKREASHGTNGRTGTGQGRAGGPAGGHPAAGPATSAGTTGTADGPSGTG